MPRIVQLLPGSGNGNARALEGTRPAARGILRGKSARAAALLEVPGKGSLGRHRGRELRGRGVYTIGSMSDLACDRCGRSLLAFEDVRYKLEIKVYAAYDTLELTKRDLEERDHDAEIQRLIELAAKRDPAELEAEVFKELAFDLCLRCQKEFLEDPLPPRRGDD
jgi:hypothetical protein